MNPLTQKVGTIVQCSQRVSSKACKARYQHVRMGIPAGDSLDFIDSRKHVPFFMHFWELKIYLFLLLPSRPRSSRVAERRATHQIPLESRKIPSKLRVGNLMGRAALKSVGENPKPTGTFRPGGEGTEKSRNFTQTKGLEMSTVMTLQPPHLRICAKGELKAHTARCKIMNPYVTMLIKYWNILKPLPAVCHSLCPVSRRVLRRRRLHKILSTPIRLMSAAPFLGSKLVSMSFSNITVEVALFGSHERISVEKMVWTTGLTPDPLCVLPFNGLEKTYVYAGVIGYYPEIHWLLILFRVN